MGHSVQNQVWMDDFGLCRCLSCKVLLCSGCYFTNYALNGYLNTYHLFTKSFVQLVLFLWFTTILSSSGTLFQFTTSPCLASWTPHIALVLQEGRLGIK